MIPVHGAIEPVSLPGTRTKPHGAGTAKNRPPTLWYSRGDNVQNNDLNKLNEHFLRFEVKGNAWNIHRNVVEIGGHPIKFYCDHITNRKGRIRRGYTFVACWLTEETEYCKISTEERRLIWKELKTYIRSKVNQPEEEEQE
jgi:hypothetical protein